MRNSPVQAETFSEYLRKRGYTIVPMEPTPEMIEAGIKAWATNSGASTVDIYRAMLAALDATAGANSE